MLWRKVHLAAMALVLLATFAVYAPSVHYGLIWDDPLWFGRVVGKSLAELLAPMPDFQYYRPGTMLYNALFVSGNGIMAPEIVHSLQIVWHLLNVALLYTFTRALGCAGPLAVTSAALFA